MTMAHQDKNCICNKCYNNWCALRNKEIEEEHSNTIIALRAMADCLEKSGPHSCSPGILAAELPSMPLFSGSGIHQIMETIKVTISYPWGG